MIAEKVLRSRIIENQVMQSWFKIQLNETVIRQSLN